MIEQRVKSKTYRAIAIAGALEAVLMVGHENMELLQGLIPDNYMSYMAFGNLIMMAILREFTKVAISEK